MHFSIQSREAATMARTVRSVWGEQLSLRYLPGDHYRYSVVISKKHGNASERNRTKRILREIMRIEKSRFPAGSYLIYINRRCSSLDASRFLSELETLIPRTHTNAL